MTAGHDPAPSAVPRAVLDTSALFSQHRHWLWEFARHGYYVGVWSTYIVGELVRVRIEHSIAHGVERSVYRKRINDLIHALSAVLVIGNYRDVDTGGVLSDPDDEPILATALAAGAGVIVSLNTRDFPPDGVVLGVRFLTPDDFLTELDALYPGHGLIDRARDIDRQLP